MKLTIRELDICWSVRHHADQFITHKQLGQYIQMDGRAACRHVHALVDKGVLALDLEGRRTRYRLLLPVYLRAPVRNARRMRGPFANVPPDYFEDDERACRPEGRWRPTIEPNQTLGGVWHYGP